MALVSAIIPVYNVERRIPAAVDSTLALRNECGLEVVVVDDGSTDSTSEILKQYGDGIKILSAEKRGKVIGAQPRSARIGGRICGLFRRR